MSIEESALLPSEVTGETLRLLFVPLSALNIDRDLWARNAKKHDSASILASIERSGFVDPPKWDSNLNNGAGGLVFGNGRTKAIVSILLAAQKQGKKPPRGIPTAKDTGEWCVPVKFGVDSKSEVEAIAFAIDHNNLTMSGGDFDASDIAKMWNTDYVDLLKYVANEEVMPVSVEPVDLADLMMAIDDEGDGRSGLPSEKYGEEEAIEEDDFEPSEDPEYVPRVKVGEIWKLGRHYIACGDCTIEANIRSLMTAGNMSKVDCVWADPPYGVNAVKHFEKEEVKGFVSGSDCRRTTIAENAVKKERLGKVGADKPFGSADVRGTVSATNIVKANKYFPVYGDDSIDIAVASFLTYRSLFDKVIHCWWGGNHYCEALPSTPCWIVWDKENTGDFADGELAWCSEKSAVRIFRHMWNGMVKASEHGQRRIHPTQKPIALAAWFFEKYGKVGDVIVDPFLGSGMSVMAAEKLDRTVIGFELSNHYCSLICDRWEASTGLKAEKIGVLPDAN